MGTHAADGKVRVNNLQNREPCMHNGAEGSADLLMVHQVKKLAVANLRPEIRVPHKLDDGVQMSIHLLLAPPFLILSFCLQANTDVMHT